MNVAKTTAAGKMVIFLLAAVYIAQQLTHWPPLVYVIGCLACSAVLLMLPQLKGVAKWLTLSFLTCGAAIMLAQRVAVGGWLEAAGMNATLVTLFVFAPLFGIPVRLPEYVAALKRFYETRMRSDTALFIGTQLLTQIMGGFINVGSIPVVYHLVFVKPRSSRISMLLAAAINRGFGGAICWSPYFAAMTLVTSALSLNWSALLPYLIGLALLSITASVAADWKALMAKDEQVADVNVRAVETGIDDAAGPAAAQSIVGADKVRRGEKGGAAPVPASRHKMSTRGESAASSFPLGLALYLAAATAAILLLEQLLSLPMVIITCISAIVFPLVWCVAKGAMPVFRQGLGNHVNVTLPALQKEITLFLAAGFFSGSIATTGLGASIPDLLLLIPLPIALSFSLFTLLLMAGTSLIGLHPIVVTSILATTIDPALVQISPVYFAILLLGSWGLSNPISPASAVNNLLAGLFNKSVFELARPNYKYAAALGLLLLVYLMFI